MSHPQVPKTTIHVFENNDASVTLKITKKTDAGVVPYTITPASDDAEFFIKASYRDDDADALATYTSTSGAITFDVVTDTLVTVQMVAADLATAGEFSFHLDILEGGSLRKTVSYGTLHVVNI